MKKTLTTLSAIVALAFGASAQYQYMEYTPYKGAFAPAPTPMWTDGWTEWNPQTKSYPATSAEISSNITTDMTLTNDKVWLLKNKVYVTNGAKLTIQPGTIIRGDKSTAGSLIITRGSKIYAWGTQQNPIVFTSNFDQGLRNPGDFGGLIVLGNATMNQTVPQVVEGGLDATLGAYGGTDDEDNSGVIQYVRIEFGGFPFAPDKEINGLTMGAVGKNTVIDHVQCSYTNDDSFEWFGGAVNARFLVAFAGTDDDFDTDYGFHGSVQFGLGLRDPNYSDQCTCSSSEGFESDNDGTGTDLTPFTSAKFANITIVGPLRGNTAATVNSKFQRALRIRRNSALNIYNSVFTDWPKGLLLDGDKTAQKAKDGVLEFKSNIIAGVGAAPVATNAPTVFADQAALDAWYAAGNNTKEATSANLFTSPFPGDINVAGDFRPSAGSALLTAGVNLFVNNTFDPINPKSTDFVGAFAPAPKVMWTDGWANWNPQTVSYPATNAEISSNITSDMILTNDKVWLLKNKVYVTNGATLIIQPGTIIRGDKSTAGTLIISKGSKIHAMGTKEQPIVFTSNFDQGLRNPGDFGGVILLGQATINQTVPQVIEGGLDATLGSYGGTMDDDYSGVMQYVRIEFGGFPFAPDKEINGLTFGGVGRTTAIHHIQCSYTNDDSFEWFGGVVNTKYLVAFAGTDDDFDTDYGFSGNVQYGLGLRDPNYSDQCTCSSSEGFESDNDGTGTDLNPRTSVNFYNMTLVGPLRGNVAATVNSKYQRAFRIRRNSQLNTYNTIAMDWPKGLLLDGDKTAQRAKDGQLKFQGNIIAGMASAPKATNAAAGVLTQNELDVWFAASSNVSVASSAGLLENPFPGDINVAGDFRFKGDLSLLITTGFQEDVFATSTEAMLVFPNPANENVTIALNKEYSNSTITIQNAIGMSVASAKAFGESVKFDVSGFANGLYIVTINNGSKAVSKTLVINR